MGWAWAWNGLAGRKMGYKPMPFPVNPHTVVTANRVHFDIDNLNNFKRLVVIGG